MSTFYIRLLVNVIIHNGFLYIRGKGNIFFSVCITYLLNYSGYISIAYTNIFPVILTYQKLMHGIYHRVQALNFVCLRHFRHFIATNTITHRKSGILRSHHDL